MARNRKQTEQIEQRPRKAPAKRKPRPAPVPRVTETIVGRIGWQAVTRARLLVLGYSEARARELVRRVAETRAPERDEAETAQQQTTIASDEPTR